MSAKGSLPKNWPPGVPYLRTPVYSPTLTASHLTSLRTRPQDAKDLPRDVPRGPGSHVKITPITTPAHPAHGQSGLFATKDLKPGTFILQYLGEIHASADTSPSVPGAVTQDPHADSNYDVSLDRELGIGIDAGQRGSEARFINDYRGVADRPNAEFKEIWDAARKERGMGVWVLPEGKSGRGKGIKKGEEILVSYGRGFWAARQGEDG